MKPVQLKQESNHPRPSVPAPGSSLFSATELRAPYVRAAVSALYRSLETSKKTSPAWEDMLASRWLREPFASEREHGAQAAWGLVAMRLVGRSRGFLSASASMRDAETWFLGTKNSKNMLSDILSAKDDQEAVQALESISYDEDLSDLLPYLLDSHGPGSRATVLKDPRTGAARKAKKEAGVFYTPSDVAEYIAGVTLAGFGSEIESSSVLDPACGSGVFLKAALYVAAEARPDLQLFDFIKENIFGVDIDPLAVQAACFVLLHECLRQSDLDAKQAPWSIWHRIRCNVCVADSLVLQLSKPNIDRSKELSALEGLLNVAFPSPSEEEYEYSALTTLFSNGVALGSIFPALKLGVDAVIGNPPYARIGSRGDSADLANRFSSLAGVDAARADFFPLFVEMMWQLAKPGKGTAGMVVPLSLAYSGRPQMVGVRKAIEKSGGKWRFAFFDRQPHALFGEEVKTRNSILFREPHALDQSEPVQFQSGPLRKWTSRQRAGLFGSIDFTMLGGSSISAGIPKLQGKLASKTYDKLRKQPWCLRDMFGSIGSSLPGNVAAHCPETSVFVGGTAYNYLNVFRPHRSLPDQNVPWSSSKVLAMSFSNSRRASKAFAILSSRVAFWLWHVDGDGFHVTRSFVENLPFSDRVFAKHHRDQLASLGSKLWDDLQEQQITSVNGGRLTVAYRPHASETLRDEIDSLLLKVLDIDAAFTDYLRGFSRNVVEVDSADKSRQRFANQFTKGVR